IDVVLDPMWQGVKDLLLDPVDGVRSTAPRPAAQTEP
ncbi:MAG: NYN domain-containing protein, partial [Planctomycetota bacterium]